MRFEVDINLTSWECTGNHKLSLFLSLRVEIYCFIWGSCLEKVSFFLLLLIYFPSYFFYKVVRNKRENWNLFWFRTYIELLVSFSCNIGKVLVLKERQTYYFSNYFPVFLQFFPVLCNLAWTSPPPPTVYLNPWKLLPSNSIPPGPRLCSNALPKLIFLKKENSATVTFYSITKL